MPDIIVVDSTLSDMPAIEFIQRVRGIATPVKPSIMICLAEIDIGAIMRAKRAGAEGYLLKPFNRPQLLQRFRSLNPRPDEKDAQGAKSTLNRCDLFSGRCVRAVQVRA